MLRKYNGDYIYYTIDLNAGLKRDIRLFMGVILGGLFMLATYNLY